MPTKTPAPTPVSDEKNVSYIGNNKLITLPEKLPVSSGDGYTTLPGGGTIHTQGGVDGKNAKTIYVPPGTVITDDGRISVPKGSNGATVTYGNGYVFGILESAMFILDDKAPLGYRIIAENRFVDVGEDDWFFSYVMFVHSHGLMAGTLTKSLKFHPDSAINRGMLTTILYNMEGCPDVSGLSNPFKDNAGNMWYHDAVIWAVANGIASGYGNGRFGPGDIINREQIAVILTNYIKYKGYALPAKKTVAFDDEASISKWALEAVSAIQAAGIVSGRPGNVYDPKGTATRAETAAIITRLIEACGGASKGGVGGKSVFDVYVDKSAMESIERALFVLREEEEKQ